MEAIDGKPLRAVAESMTGDVDIADLRSLSEPDGADDSVSSEP